MDVDGPSTPFDRFPFDHQATLLLVDSDWTRADAVALGVLTANGGIARIGAFLAAGLTRHQIAAIFRRGVIERPRNAWFVDPTLPWQAKRAVTVGGVLACVSAAASFGLPVPPGAQQRIHVLLQHNAPRVRHNRDKRHEVVPGEDREVERHWAPRSGAIAGWRTSLVETLVHLEGCVPVEWWIAALDAARHVPRDSEAILDDDGFRRLTALLPARLQHELDRVDPLAASVLETLLRLGLIRRGIGPVVLQFSPDGWQAVDFLVGAHLIVEADGAAFHDAEMDAVRDAAFRRLGYVVLRFSYDRIVNDLDAVLDEIEAALAGTFIS